MKRKKFLYGFLAAALLIGSVTWPAPEAKASAPDIEAGLTAYYTFDEGTLANSKGTDNASAVVTNLSPYTGDVSYDTGRTGETNDRAVRLGDYGLKLNRAGLGDSFTVSMWLKPDGTLNANQSVLFLGCHDPEKWFGVAGNAADSSECKVWANGNGYNWEIFGTMSIDSSKWHLLTLTGTGSMMSAWLDGQPVASGTTNGPLTGENQDIYVGVTYWDAEFSGLVDEVRVYSRPLSEGEIYQLYDGRTAEEMLSGDGIKAQTIALRRGGSQIVDLGLPSTVTEAGVKLSYESSNPSVVSVDENGKLTGAANGTASITVTASLGNVAKTATLTVTVNGELSDYLKAYFPFDDDLKNAQDTSGNNAAEAFQTSLTAYDGGIRYDTGIEGRAVSLGDYGLKLNQTNLGSEYTVSLWFRPSVNLAKNQCMMLLGRGTDGDEQWTAVSGDSAGVYKIWANGGGYSWKTLFSPEVTAREWSQLTLTGKDETITAYLDGICLGTEQTNDPLNGENQDIYLGVNYWDAEFSGLMDEVKIYSVALNETEVQEQAKEAFEEKLQEKLENGIAWKNIRGGNTSADQVKYSLTLPDTLGGLPVVWKSSNESVVSADGTVTTPAETTAVTLTATVSSGTLSASETFALSVLKLDRSALDELIEEAKAVDRENLLETSAGRLDESLAAARKELTSFEAVDTAYDRLSKALSQLCYLDDYMHPFAFIKEPVVKTAKAVRETEVLFSLPGNVVDAVDVEYVSERPEIVSYSDGTITALSPGKTVVTAIVTSKYDGWKMEYSTAVSVEKAASAAAPAGTGSTGTGSHSKGGGSGSSGSESSASSQIGQAANAKTGDSTNIWLPVVLIVLACAGLGGFWFYKKRKEH